MSGTTTTQGYPYPSTSDFSDVQDAFRLASAIDTDLRAEQAPFRAFMGRPAFIGRQTSNGSGFIAGTSVLTMGAIDYDSTGTLSAGSSIWNQPFSDGPSWWLFGAFILVSVTGTPVVGDMNMVQIETTTLDQVTGAQTVNNYYQRNDDTNTNGEWLNMFAMAQIWQGSAQAALILNGSTTKAIQAGSRFWGMYMGPVV